ncbi:MAG: LysR family transcriptional regulator [Sphingorhabdus sp.]|nr:LysR family transcriptional regulator [Sphingorhabdus sp.]
MQWDDLRFFLAVARKRTLASAAKSLSVDATTVGRKIDRLAAELKASLFEIGPAGHMLTASGNELLKHAEEAERSFIAAASAVTGEHSRFVGTVRLSLSEGFATWVVAKHMQSFRALHPEINLEIVTTNGFLNPSKREADLAVMLARPVKGPLIARKLANYSLGLYASGEYLDAHSEPKTLEDLKQHVLIGYIPDFIYAEELRYLPEIDDSLVPTLSSTSINVQHAMTRSGLGISVLPNFIGGLDSALRPILPVLQIRRSFWVVVHRDLAGVARVRAVIDWLDTLVQDRSSSQAVFD